MIVEIPASALAVGSWLALIPAAGFCVAIVRRAGIEDAFLKRNLAGYIDYTQRVRGGLFPRQITKELESREPRNSPSGALSERRTGGWPTLP